MCIMLIMICYDFYLFSHASSSSESDVMSKKTKRVIPSSVRVSKCIIKFNPLTFCYTHRKKLEKCIKP